MSGTDRLFPKAKTGDSIRASEWNDITRQIVSLSSLGDDMHVMVTGAGMFRRAKKPSAAPARVIFQIVAYQEYSETAYCSVGYSLCNGSVPGRDAVTDLITVTDPTGCFFSNEDANSLIGRLGWADWVRSYPGEESNECFWAVSSLCCQFEVG